ncbi:MAG: PD-(D/E)XK nuclease family protein [Actinomycetota bacterium]|nr:PD-(D/E)XK nuclease family protein [Actinomycetota bacterium]
MHTTAHGPPASTLPECRDRGAQKRRRAGAGDHRRSAIGRAVHAVLQSVDLATGAGLGDLCAGQAAAEGVLGREDIIAALCRSALDSPLVAQAARSEHWREVYVGIPYGEGVQGYIDLLYRCEHGLVIVDYKTDSWRDATDLDQKVAHYRVQLDAYRTAVREITGETRVDANLLFLTPGEPARTVPV